MQPWRRFVDHDVKVWVTHNGYIVGSVPAVVLGMSCHMSVGLTHWSTSFISTVQVCCGCFSAWQRVSFVCTSVAYASFNTLLGQVWCKYKGPLVPTAPEVRWYIHTFISNISLEYFTVGQLLSESDVRLFFPTWFKLDFIFFLNDSEAV